LIGLKQKLIILFFVLQGSSWAQLPGSAWVIGGPNGDSWNQAVERSIALDDTSLAGSIQPIEIPRGHNLLREQLRSGTQGSARNLFGYGYHFAQGPITFEADTLRLGWNSRLWDKLSGFNSNQSTISRGLVDGDGLTLAFLHEERADGTPTLDKFFTIDIGVPVPIDSISFFPPQSGLFKDGRRQRALFPVAYEVSRGNTPVDWLIYADEDVAAGTPGYHPLEEILGSTFTNNTSVVSLKSSLRFTRFLRFKFGRVTSTGILAEVEAFGRGFPAEARYISKPRSFGEQVSLGKVTWQFTKYRQAPSGEVFADPTAPVELLIRSRSGLDADPIDYAIYDEFGDKIRVDRDAYFAAPPPRSQFEVSLINGGGLTGFRASRTDDITDWNNWSVPYRASGDEIRSSDGREFFQFRFEIKTEDPFAFGILDSLAFEISPVLADSVLAEVSLEGLQSAEQGITEVPLGVETLFVYDIRTVSGDRPGFDGIELDLPAKAEFVDLERDGVLLAEGADFSLDISNGQLRVTFAEPSSGDATLRLRFRSAIYQASVFFEGRIFNSDAEVASLPQSIESGDARVEIGSNAIQVVATEIQASVLGQLTLSSPVITPNGDGINEETIVAFQLFGIEDAEVMVTVYDLAGHRLTSLLDDKGGAGLYGPSWDGKDRHGKMVPPGIYLIGVEIDVDEGKQTLFKPVSVVY